MRLQKVVRTSTACLVAATTAVSLTVLATEPAAASRRHIKVLTAGHTKVLPLVSAYACRPFKQLSPESYGTATESVTNAVIGSDGVGSINPNIEVHGLPPGDYVAGNVVLNTNNGKVTGKVTSCSEVSFLRDFVVVNNGELIEVDTGTPVPAGKKYLVQTVIVPAGQPVTNAVLASKPFAAKVAPATS